MNSIETIISGLTDIHVKSFDLKNSLLFPEQESFVDYYDDFKKIEKMCKIELSNNNGSNDFSLKVFGSVFRGAIVHTLEGSLYTLRVIKSPTPYEKLGMHRALTKSLMSPKLMNGGIVLFTGLPGNGKTTVCVSTIIERLKKFGGVCYTVEDPPEIPFQGHHGKGVCFQTDARSNGGFAPSIKNLLRAYPTGKSSMMFVGEIRDPDAAMQTLMSAIDGRLVFATMHAGSLEDAINRIINMAAENLGRKPVLSIMSDVLKLIVHQHLRQSTLKQEYFTSNPTISALIHSDKITQVVTELERQTLIHNKSHQQ
jgi:twitching motility protein PilT